MMKLFHARLLLDRAEVVSDALNEFELEPSLLQDYLAQNLIFDQWFINLTLQIVVRLTVDESLLAVAAVLVVLG